MSQGPCAPSLLGRKDGGGARLYPFSMEGPMPDQDFLIDMTMAEIMARWPALIPVLMKERLLCVGCPISPFHTLADAAKEHGRDPEALFQLVLDEIRRIRAGPA